MRAADLLNRLNDEPFRGFRVHLSNGAIIEVTHPGMMIVGPSSAVLPTEWARDEDGHRLARSWRTVALSHMVQFTDLSEPADGKRRRRK